jgi:uncharacterized protein (DUF2147 family)
MKKQPIVFILVLILVAAGSFFGGMKYGQSKVVSSSFSQGNFPEANGVNFARPNGSANGAKNSGNSMTIGEIIAKDDTSLTVKIASGSTQIILLAASTEFVKTTTGAVDDFKVGDNVMVNGSSNSDGSVTASSVQLRTGMAGFGMPSDQNQPTQK